MYHPCERVSAQFSSDWLTGRCRLNRIVEHSMCLVSIWGFIIDKIIAVYASPQSGCVDSMYVNEPGKEKDSVAQTRLFALGYHAAIN